MLLPLLLLFYREIFLCSVYLRFHFICINIYYCLHYTNDGEWKILILYHIAPGWFCLFAGRERQAGADVNLESVKYINRHQAATSPTDSQTMTSRHDVTPTSGYPIRPEVEDRNSRAPGDVTLRVSPCANCGKLKKDVRPAWLHQSVQITLTGCYNTFLCTMYTVLGRVFSL